MIPCLGINGAAAAGRASGRGPAGRPAATEPSGRRAALGLRRAQLAAGSAFTRASSTFRRPPRHSRRVSEIASHERTTPAPRAQPLTAPARFCAGGAGVISPR